MKNMRQTAENALFYIFLYIFKSDDDNRPMKVFLNETRIQIDIKEFSSIVL